ncbi:hypothetical protein ACWC2T_46005, partial [Streptomyces sp. NPDC001393]
ARAMLEALIAGERDPRVLAEMAKASMRAKREGTCPRVVDTSDPGPGGGRVGGIFYGDEGLLA